MLKKLGRKGGGMVRCPFCAILVLFEFSAITVPLWQEKCMLKLKFKWW
jgi:hypothetical protein